jgi:hypothetical protein
MTPTTWLWIGGIVWIAALAGTFIGAAMRQRTP